MITTMENFVIITQRNVTKNSNHLDVKGQQNMKKDSRIKSKVQCICKTMKTIYKMGVVKSLSIITLNVSQLNCLIKRHKIAE